MVKPIYPSRRSCGYVPSSQHPVQGADQATHHGRDDFLNGFPGEDRVTAAYLPSPSGYMGQNVASHDEAVFSNYTSPALGLGSTAPRERISSLPDEETRSMPQERRRSAPADIDVDHGSSSRNVLPPELQEIAAKGQELFWFILSEGVKAQEASSPGSLSALTVSPSSQRTEILNERGRFGGRSLRQIAEAFSHSSQRLKVQEYAEQVNFRSLDYNSFSDLLFGLFQEGGVTQARVLVLFFFCADLALRALREKLTHHFQKLVDWTSRYITERLSAWVLDHGGWAAVLQESMDQACKVAVVGLSIVSIAALAFILWRHR